MGAFAQSKYCVQGYAFCPTGTLVWHGDLRAAHRRNHNVVEDACNDTDFVRAITGKCEAKVAKKASSNMTLAILFR